MSPMQLRTARVISLPGAAEFRFEVMPVRGATWTVIPWEDASAAPRDTALADVVTVLVGGADAASPTLAGWIGWVRETAPHIAIVGICPTVRRARRTAESLVDLGVDDIVLAEDTRPVLVAELVAGAHRANAVRRAVRVLRGGTTRTLFPLVEYAVVRGARRPSVEAAATELGVHRRTLVNLTHRAGAPPPGMILGWGRLLLACALLEHDVYSVETAARLAHYSSSTALCNVLRRYMHMNPTTVRARGGLAMALEMFGATVAEKLVAAR